MNKLLVVVSILVFILTGCDEPAFEKPEHLIKEKQMINMLVDIHIAEATYNKVRYDSIMKTRTSADFYYSVLRKYNVPDSVFEKSFVFYASAPRSFEKMYRKVMNRLSEIEQSYSGRKEDLLKFNKEKEKKIK